jgi:hypothetical protein
MENDANADDPTNGSDAYLDENAKYPWRTLQIPKNPHRKAKMKRGIK